jgi:hypothetical protein
MIGPFRDWYRQLKTSPRGTGVVEAGEGKNVKEK